jgi:hypothetical protein
VYIRGLVLPPFHFLSFSPYTVICSHTRINYVEYLRPSCHGSDLHSSLCSLLLVFVPIPVTDLRDYALMRYDIIEGFYSYLCSRAREVV